MGEVFKARDTRLGRNVAIKILPAAVANDERLRTRFTREAQAISQLSHPHICTLHNVGDADGAIYLVMELLDGETLADRLARGPMALRDVFRYGIEIASALERAHRSGIVHRDLKPGTPRPAEIPRTAWRWWASVAVFALTSCCLFSALRDKASCCEDGAKQPLQAFPPSRSLQATGIMRLPRMRGRGRRLALIGCGGYLMKTTKLAIAAAVTLFLTTIPAAMANADKKDHDRGRGHDKVKSEDSMKGNGWNEQERGEINQQFARYDRNGDGVISRTEFSGDAALFDRLDLNRDGLITRTEATQVVPDRGSLENQIRSYDRNGDGVISRSEFPGSAADFDRLDRNRDGVLSQADRGAAGQEQRQMRFRGMDQNGDGVISRSEWRGNDKSFRKHDRNHDGVLSGDELRGNGHGRHDDR